MRIDIKGTSTTVLGELLTHEVKKHGATLDSIGGPGLPGLSKAIPCIVSTISITMPSLSASQHAGLITPPVPKFLSWRVLMR
jgi:hypothetical protein